MSKENVRRFYELLEVDEVIRREAMTFQEKFTEQEEIIDAFIALAERQGLFFTDAELIEHIFENGKEVRE